MLIAKKALFNKKISGFSNPESTYFEPKTKLTFVSNIEGEGNLKDGKGYISILSAFDGKVINKKWVTGLNAPKGMRSYNGNLWVSDIDRVLVINISNGQIYREIKIPEAKFLNDIAITPDGTVYVSDTIGSSIYQIKDYKSSVFATGSHLESPNGLLYSAEKLYVAAWGLTTDWSTKVPGKLYSIDIQKKIITDITEKPLGNLDGLELTGKGSFLISDWVAGKIYEVNPKGKVTLIFKSEKGIADIGFSPEDKLIIVPSMLKNEVFTLVINN